MAIIRTLAHGLNIAKEMQLHVVRIFLWVGRSLRVESSRRKQPNFVSLCFTGSSSYRIFMQKENNVNILSWSNICFYLFTFASHIAWY